MKLLLLLRFHCCSLWPRPRQSASASW